MNTPERNSLLLSPSIGTLRQIGALISNDMQAAARAITERNFDRNDPLYQAVLRRLACYESDKFRSEQLQTRVSAQRNTQPRLRSHTLRKVSRRAINPACRRLLGQRYRGAYEVQGLADTVQ